jgi:hypothetical protein
MNAFCISSDPIVKNSIINHDVPKRMKMLLFEAEGQKTVTFRVQRKSRGDPKQLKWENRLFFSRKQKPTALPPLKIKLNDFIA